MTSGIANKCLTVRQTSPVLRKFDSALRVQDCLMNRGRILQKAKAEFALHELRNLRGRRVRVLLQKRKTAHNHSRCAVSTPKRLLVQKRLLWGMQPAVFFETFDCPDGLCGLSQRHLARTPGRPADQYCARSTLSFSTPVLRARQSNFFTQNK
jgi:hypothetical protein